MFYRTIDEHLALKLFSPRDAEEAFGLIDADREHLRAYLAWVDTILTVADERASLTKLGRVDPDQGVSCFLTLDGAIIGAVGLPIIDRTARWGEIGYWIGSAHEGHGYVTRAVQEIERLAFTDLGLERVQITNDVANTRSRAIPERLGYTLEGILRHHLLSGEGRIVDRSVYGLLKSEWQAREPDRPLCEPIRASREPDWAATDTGCGV